MIKNLIYFIILFTPVFGSGGYDHGTAAGKNNWDISLTWNPFKYFKHGQSYIVLGYGLTDKMDIHGYISDSNDYSTNYYAGLSYQFFKSKRLDISTAIGLRKYVDSSTTHLFLPQLLYTYRINNIIKIAGSFVNIKNQDINNKNLGFATDVFLIFKVYENNKYNVDFTFGAFKPVIWKPDEGSWYPTYSVDFKFKSH
jgi:hypothetical protein